MAGSEFARHLLGDFALAVFDPRLPRLMLARDAMGLRPLYFRQETAFVMFASEIKALVTDDFQIRPNDHLLAELLLRQTHRRRSDGSTLFQNIHQIPPGHVGVFTPFRSELQRYWDFNLSASVRASSFDECAEEFHRLFQRAVRRRLRSTRPVAIAVSGGLDSSAIFCTACGTPSPAEVVGLTYSARDGGASDETAFVSILQTACGRSIEHVDTPFDGLLFRSPEMVRTTEAPMLDGQWYRGERLLEAVKSHESRTLISGHWGDQLLFEQAYLVDLFRRGAWRVTRRHLDEYLAWFPDAAGDEFSTRFRADLVEYAMPHWVRRALRSARRHWNNVQPWDAWYRDSFRAEARPDTFTYPASAVGASAHARALYREVRSQYHDFCLEWNNKAGASHGVEPAFPFLDRDLVEFVISLPGDVLVRDGVPKSLLRHSLAGVVPAQILQRRTKADFTLDVNRSAREHFSAIADLLAPGALVVELGYVDADKLRRGLTAARTAIEQPQSSVASWRVSAVAAFELWLRQFVEPTRTGERTCDAQAPAS
jgi:asparagine synthase (glutamine-hydrolysing)